MVLNVPSDTSRIRAKKMTKPVTKIRNGFSKNMADYALQFIQ
jgi:hypothetical protein